MTPIDEARTSRETPTHLIRNYFEILGGVEDFWGKIDWDKLEGVPRYECWMNSHNLSYTYGSGDRQNMYIGKDWIYQVYDLMCVINRHFDTRYDCCMINGYRDGTQALGYHADDSPEMDMDHPIAIASVGATREIRFRKQTDKGDTPLGYNLENGSLCVMSEGMQRDWFHKIPKSSRAVGPRISMTFRKLVL